MSTAPNGTNQVIVLQARDLLGLNSTNNQNPPYQAVQLLANYLQAAQANGTLDAVMISPDVSGDAAKAGAIVAGSSLSGTVGVDVNGIALTVTAAVSDQASINALLAVINASTDALVQGIVQAGRAAFAQVTCATVVAGQTVTLAGVTLTGVAGTRQFRQFSVDTSDTACAADLVLAINGDPVLGQFFHAYSSSGVVKVYPTYPGATPPAGCPNELLTSSNGTTLACVAMTADPSFAITAMRPGAIGNGISLIATGTGASLVSGTVVTPTVAYASGNRLLKGGLGNNATQANLFYGRY